MMLEMLLFSTRELPGNVRCVLTAGSPLSERTSRDFHKRFAVAVRPLYGSTETGGISVAPAGGDPLCGETIGPPMRSVSVEVRPLAQSAGLGDGVGLLYVRSSSMMAGYLGDEGLDESWVDDGWFCTGDLARIDSAGNIHLLGRQTEVINVGGMKVVPAEVEEVLASLPGVQEVKVYAGRRRDGRNTSRPRSSPNAGWEWPIFAGIARGTWFTSSGPIRSCLSTPCQDPPREKSSPSTPLTPRNRCS